MLLDVVDGERTSLLLLLLDGWIASAAAAGLGSSLVPTISGEVNGLARLDGSCMFVKSKAPEGGERGTLVGLVISPPPLGEV